MIDLLRFENERLRFERESSVKLELDGDSLLLFLDLLDRKVSYIGEGSSVTSSNEDFYCKLGAQELSDFVKTHLKYYIRSPS